MEGSNQTGPITLVFDYANSSNLNFMLKRFSVKDVKALRLYTSNSNEKVIDFVKENRSAIGFIGVNWISDGNAALTDELSSGLRVLGLSLIHI